MKKLRLRQVEEFDLPTNDRARFQLRSVRFQIVSIQYLLYWILGVAIFMQNGGVHNMEMAVICFLGML